MDHGELALCSGLEKELLNGCGGCMGEDYFIGVDVVQSIGRNLVVHLSQFVDDLSNSIQDFGANIPGWSMSQ